jgi:aminomethyltransferase
MKTPLYETHVALEGRMVEFGGFELPVQYENTGIKAEHTAVRTGVGVFDVSHMGELLMSGPDAEKQLNRLVTNQVAGMPNGKVLYSLMCNEDGGIVDDLLIYKRDENSYLIVVNASNIEKDFEWMKSHLEFDVKFENISAAVGQIAVQGPKAVDVVTRLFPDAAKLHNYTFFETKYEGGWCVVSRTGYTGEDGFELYVDADKVVDLWNLVLKTGKPEGIVPCGLGARDTLRFEAGMPLYGHELGDSIPANEVGLNFAIKLDKGDFVGREAIINHTASYCRRGIKMLAKGIAREGSPVYQGTRNVGYVTSGNFSVTNGVPLAMVRVQKGVEGKIEVELRGKRLPAEFVRLPFITKQNNK